VTIQEIEEFVQGELSYLNLSTKEIEKYIKFILKIDRFLNKYNLDGTEIKNRFIQKLEDCIEFFKIQGFDDETCLEFAKKMVLESDRKDFKEKLSFLRAINLEEIVIMSDSQSLRFNIQKAHAKKMCLVNINDIKNQTRSFIIHETDDKAAKKLGIANLEMLVQQYPITKDIKEIWMIITSMTNSQFQDYFKLTREQLSYIYPTTKDELATLHFIAQLKDQEIIERYGITREELLNKHPLNNDTLKALKSIKQSNDKAVEKIFKKPKQEVLLLRTITTDMIKIAQQERLSLNRKPYTKEELRQQFKTMKKGTHPIG